MKRIRILTLLNAVFFLAAFLISISSQFKVFSTKDIGQVSGKYDTIFAPAGSTFSVWGVIYVSLFCFCIYHVVQAFRQPADAEANWEAKQIDILFAINNMAAGGWVLAWLNEHLVLSVSLMIVQLLTLISVNIQLDIYDPYKSLASKIATQFPLSIYFAWICVATIANISAVLLAHGWGGWGITPANWTIVLIAATALVSAYIILARRDLFFGLVIIWALYGIIVKRTAIDEEAFKNVINAAWSAIGLVVLAAVIQLLRARKADKFL